MRRRENKTHIRKKWLCGVNITTFKRTMKQPWTSGGIIQQVHLICLGLFLIFHSKFDSIWPYNLIHSIWSIQIGPSNLVQPISNVQITFPGGFRLLRRRSMGARASAEVHRGISTLSRARSASAWRFRVACRFQFYKALGMWTTCKIIFFFVIRKFGFPENACQHFE